MLTLTRRAGERIHIGDDIIVEVVSTGPNRARIGIRALKSVPIVRGELLDQVQAANRSASEPALSGPTHDAIRRRNDALLFPRGLLGFEGFKRWVLCELADPPPGSEQIGLRVLVAQEAPEIRLLVVDLELVAPDYPVARAMAETDIEEEAVVAAIINVPVDGRPATVNLAAPLVVGLHSRRGVQVIVSDPRLSVSALLREVLERGAVAPYGEEVRQ